MPSEWWTYRPADLLMFSHDTYVRLFELYNRDIWPLHLVAIAIGVLLILLLSRERPPWSGRVIGGVLALAWIWIGWAFFLERYATINWAGRGFAAAWFTQAAALAAGAITNRFSIDGLKSSRARIGFGLVTYAVVIHAAVWPIVGRPWQAAELFAITPDPTAIATIGLALSARGVWVRIGLAIIPLLWCVVSATTLAVM